MSDNTIIVFIVIVFISLMSIVEYSLDKKACYQQFKNYNPSYGIIQGCMIDYKGQHIPSDNMRVV